MSRLTNPIRKVCDCSAHAARHLRRCHRYAGAAMRRHSDAIMTSIAPIRLRCAYDRTVCFAFSRNANMGAHHAQSRSTHHRAGRYRHRGAPASARAATHPEPRSRGRRHVRAEDGDRGERIPGGCRAHRRRHRRSDDLGRASGWTSDAGPAGRIVRRRRAQPAAGAGQRGVGGVEREPGAVDGSFGPQTKASVKAFQTWGEVPSDGVVGDRTWSVSLHAAGATLESAVGLQFVTGYSGRPRSRAGAIEAEAHATAPNAEACHPRSPTRGSIAASAHGVAVRSSARKRRWALDGCSGQAAHDER